MGAGNIPAGEKLPSKRNLAIHLGVSVNTIQAAFNQLVAEGYVRSEQRKGFYVQEVEELIGDSVPSSQTAKKEKNLQYKIDFNSGHVDLQQFPYSVWRKLSVKSLYLDGSELLQRKSQGEPCLREQIAQYLFQSRGVRCSADQILLGAGTQVLTGFVVYGHRKRRHMRWSLQGSTGLGSLYKIKALMSS
ncbi:GntR family transcriptional regulator [Planococcus sp. MB-3u-03]|uniref:GntR family transcriptional regulator n=1 Tax=Planococcus sp. MB-3u-03 TaxID=2058136 RepID=UPI001E63DAC9|nr:GntR family transcriptional regulator [Planococcus sp. MB-3u-03]